MTVSCNVLLVILTLYGLYAFLGGVLLCVPVSDAWSPMGGARCQNKAVFFYLVAAVNMALDVIIYALPVQPVLSLHISTAQKIELLLLFTSGAL